MKKRLLVIIGSTSSGKSNLAISLAKRYGGEIVSADSRQVYRFLDHATGKILSEDQENIVHHMLDVAMPGETFSAHDFRERAIPIIEGIFSRSKVPILVGGSGFYIDAVLFENTIIDVPANEQYRKDMAGKSLEELQEELFVKNKEVYARIDPQNRRRLVRTLEIIRSLGFFPSRERRKRYDCVMIGIARSRPNLRERISGRLDERFLRMTEEIRTLLDKGISEAWFDSLGLECRHIARMLRGGVSEEQTRTNLLRAIFAYAKRQDTWWKRYDNVHWFREHEFNTIPKYLNQFFKGR